MNLEEIVKNDLGNYGQNNRRPDSLTIKDGKNWRHYELGEIVGFMISYENGNVFIAQVEEDDEYWFVPNHPTYCSAWYMEEINRTWKRTMKWFREHINYDGYNAKIIKSINYD